MNLKEINRDKTTSFNFYFLFYKKDFVQLGVEAQTYKVTRTETKTDAARPFSRNGMRVKTIFIFDNKYFL